MCEYVGESGSRQKPYILVVDDALTTRTLAVNALRAAGYETMVAEDGQKAWDLLQKNKILAFHKLTFKQPIIVVISKDLLFQVIHKFQFFIYSP